MRASWVAIASACASLRARSASMASRTAERLSRTSASVSALACTAVSIDSSATALRTITAPPPPERIAAPPPAAHTSHPAAAVAAVSATSTATSWGKGYREPRKPVGEHSGPLLGVVCLKGFPRARNYLLSPVDDRLCDIAEGPDPKAAPRSPRVARLLDPMQRPDRPGSQ